MGKYVNEGCDFFFNYLNVGAQKNSFNFQLFLCLLNVVLSLWPLICYVLYSTDVHVVFWLGPTPQYINLMVPVCLVCLNIGVNCFQCCHFRAKCAKIGCFTMFLLLGSILVGAGLFATTIAETKSAELIQNCGSSALARRLDAEWRKLNAFYVRCDPTRKKDIVTCGGFSKAFPNRVFVNYLESLEYEFDCVGFCKFWAQPIFNLDADLAIRCASALGEHVGAVAWTVGTPTAILGASLIYIGVILANYDHI